MTDPYAPNCDETVYSDEASGVCMGDASDGTVFVICLTNPSGRDLAAFLNKEGALEVFGRFHQQLREMVWLQ